MAILEHSLVRDWFKARLYMVTCHHIVLADTSYDGIRLALAREIEDSMRSKDSNIPPATPQLPDCLRSIRAKAAMGPSLVLIDNLESLDQHSAGGVEDLISQLAQIPHLVCLITTRNKSLRADKMVSAELPSVDEEDSWLIFEHRLREPIGTESKASIKALLQAMHGHPLSIVLLAAYARVNSLSNAIADWSRHGTAVLCDRRSRDKYGSLGASIELSLDSIDTCKSSASRSLLLFLSTRQEPFPVSPTCDIDIFSPPDPMAIHQLLGLCLIFIQASIYGDGVSTYCVLQPISQYMRDQYQDLLQANRPELCRGYMALHACMGPSPWSPGPWMHGSSDQNAHFKMCVCNKQRPVSGAGLHSEAYKIIVADGPTFTKSGEIGHWELGASFMNLPPFMCSLPMLARRYQALIELDPHAHLCVLSAKRSPYDTASALQLDGYDSASSMPTLTGSSEHVSTNTQ
jgi:hypothetical protein